MLHELQFFTRRAIGGSVLHRERGTLVIPLIKYLMTFSVKSPGQLGRLFLSRLTCPGHPAAFLRSWTLMPVDNNTSDRSKRAMPAG